MNCCVAHPDAEACPETEGWAYRTCHCCWWTMGCPTREPDGLFFSLLFIPMSVHWLRMQAWRTGRIATAALTQQERGLSRAARNLELALREVIQRKHPDAPLLPHASVAPSSADSPPAIG